ncbi:hypothetical protein [Billgrantia montanilacus]|uniref:hypothetical protein n=1 Tax=Billgrantia montanilacus TaxID=2282305 RepID=UPI0015F065D0|nr:hypothetical protein [Halomonas montanilacus]
MSLLLDDVSECPMDGTVGAENVPTLDKQNKNKRLLLIRQLWLIKIRQDAA